MFAIAVATLRAVFWILTVLVEGFVWVLWALVQLVDTGFDATVAFCAHKGGRLRCPRGHAVETEGAYECHACGFAYQGSVWRCGNPECGVPTPFVQCSVCHLSVRNPFRWGRP